MDRLAKLRATIALIQQCQKNMNQEIQEIKSCVQELKEKVTDLGHEVDLTNTSISNLEGLFVQFLETEKPLILPKKRPIKPGFRFETYGDYVMGPEDDGFDYEDELDDGEPPLSPTTQKRILDKVWGTKS